MEYEHPLYNPDLGRGAGPAPRDRHRPARPSPAPTTAGASTRTARAPDSPRSSGSGSRWPCRAPRAGRAAGEAGRLRHDDPAHPAQAVRADLHAPVADLAGRRRRPARPRAARPVRGARPPRRPGAVAPRERRRRSWTGTASTYEAAGCSWPPTRGPSATASTRSASSGAGTGPASLAATVVEVHNTYGDRHAYLVHTDEQGRGTVDKAMYVSPFHGTDGTYRVAAPVPATTGCTSRSPSTPTTARPFSASLTGRRSQLTPIRAAPAAIRHALLIRMHGIWLWLRRLPIQPRRPTTTTRSVPMTITPERRSANHWPGLDLVPPARARPSRARIARRLFAAAVNRLDVTVHVGAARRDARPSAGRAGDDGPPAGGVLRPDRPGRS